MSSPTTTRRVARRVSKTAAIRAFFEANPGEYMTYDDMATKFGLARNTVMKTEDRLKSEGLLLSAVLVFVDPERPR